MYSEFVIFFTIALLIVPLVVFLIILVCEIRYAISNRKSGKAAQFLLDATSKCYFYGYPVSDCLQANVPRDLYWRNVGDFFKQTGYIVLCALCESYSNATMYYHQKYEPSGKPNSYQDVWIRFYHGNQFWIFNLRDSSRLLPADSKHIPTELYNYRQTTFWTLPREKRHKIECCRQIDTSIFEPEVRFANCESEERYTNLVKQKTRFIIDWWYFCDDPSHHCKEEYTRD